MKDDIFDVIISVLLMFVTGFVIVGTIVMCYSAVQQDKRYIEELPAKREYLMTHPEIVGTNEVGEVIKRYTILLNYEKHYVYELGGTKTTIVPKPKGQMDVIVEKTN